VDADERFLKNSYEIFEKCSILRASHHAFSIPTIHNAKKKSPRPVHGRALEEIFLIFLGGLREKKMMAVTDPTHPKNENTTTALQRTLGPRTTWLLMANPEIS